MPDRDVEGDLASKSETDPDALPKFVDERFHALMLDYFAPHHVIAGEGEGARAILDLLSAEYAVEGRRTIIYADTGERACGYGRKLQSLDVDECIVVSTFVEALLRLQDVLRATPLQICLYLAGSSATLHVLSELATRHGLEPHQVKAERCESFSRRVTCSACRGTSTFDLTDALTCRTCGASFEVTTYYSDDTNSFLGLASLQCRA